MINDYGNDELVHQYVTNPNPRITYGYWEKIIYKPNEHFKSYYLLLPYYSDNTWTEDKLTFQFKRQMLYFSKLINMRLLEKQ